MAFWDTSALVKLYVRERDSDHFRQMMRASAAVPIISELSLAEMHRALWAKEFARAIPENRAEPTYRKFRSDVEAASIEIVPIGREVQDEFDRIVPLCYRTRPIVPIRAMDGLLLASALIARTPEVVSTDSRMRAAGALLGLRVLPA
jgi:predicted nucleic acid-binding protein